MLQWWQSLSAIEHGFAYIALPATIILVIQTLLLLFGLGGDGPEAAIDTDADFDADGAPDFDQGDVAELSDAGLRIFTVRGFVAFFSVFGWGGLWLLRAGIHPAAASAVAGVMGFASMIVIALILRAALRLQNDGTVELRNAIGCAGTVYLTIPANREEQGKVNVLVQERLGEFDAVTDENEAIPTGTEVLVTAVSGKTTLVVCRKQRVRS